MFYNWGLRQTCMIFGADIVPLLERGIPWSQILEDGF